MSKKHFQICNYINELKNKVDFFFFRNDVNVIFCKLLFWINYSHLTRGVIRENPDEMY